MLRQLSNIPNILTLLRIVSIIPIVLLIQYNLYISAFILTLFAQLTDFFDGLIARKTKTTTSLGTFLDPVADKVFILSLLSIFTTKGLLNPYYFCLSLSRDLLQLLAIPILVGYKKIAFKVQPKLLPKFGTVLKYIIICILFLGMIINISTKEILLPVLIVSAILEVYILSTFFFRFLKIYRGEHNTFE